MSGPGASRVNLKKYLPRKYRVLVCKEPFRMSPENAWFKNPFQPGKI